MPNIYHFIKSEKWGQVLTLLTVLGFACACFGFIFAQGAKAERIESGVEQNGDRITENTARIVREITALEKDIVPREEIEQINAEREKRMLDRAQSLEQDIEDIKEMQTEQRALSVEILKRLPRQ